MKKVLSLVLTLTMFVSLLAGLTVSVSAHQNQTMEKITFDEINEDGSLKYATGNATTTDGTYNSIKQSFEGGSFQAGHNGKYYYHDVAQAPDARYGKSLMVRETWETGASTAYVQSFITPSNNILNTVHITASLYTKKNENDAYIQRGIKLRTKTVGTSYKENFPVLFSHSGKGISVFGVSAGKNYSTDVWYDMDITYNMNNQQYHVVILENGEDFIDVLGTNTGTAITNVESMILYHSTTDSSRNDITVYWDNLLIESANKFEIPEESLYPTMDFENLRDQVEGVSNAEGLPSTYTYSFGYAANNKLPVLKALETDKGKSACIYGEPWTGTAANGTTISQYQYPQMTFGTSISQFRLKTSVKFQNTKLCGIYLNGVGQSEIMFYGGIKAFGNTLFSSYDKTGNVWYDIDLFLDTSTGYYDITMVKTDDNTVAHVSGFTTNANYLKPITSVKFGHDRGSATEATQVNESFYWIDNLYIGNYGVDDIASEYSYDFEDGIYPAGYDVEYTDINQGTISATAGELGDANAESQIDEEGNEVKAQASVAIPFINDKPGYTITAKFTLEDLNSSKLVYFGNLPILEVLTTGQVKCNQSARPYTEGYLIVGNEYTITHTINPGCTNSSTSIKGIMDVNGTVKESSAGYGSGRPTGPWEPFKIYVKPTGDAQKTSTLTLSDITFNKISYKTASSKNLRMESLENAAPNASIFLPHDKAGSGYIYTAELVFDNFNAQRTISIGDNQVATIDTTGALSLGEDVVALEAGKIYTLKIDATHGDTSTAVISLADLSDTVEASPYINLAQETGASLLTIDNVNYVSKIPFEITSDEVINDLQIEDDVAIVFSTALSDDVTADNFKVYAPSGKITDSALLADYEVTISDDRKTATLSFDKVKSAHYHIAIEATDIFGAVLSEFVEVNTKLNTQVASPIKFTNDAGAQLTILSSGNVTASTTIYSGDGSNYNANMWLALYDEAQNLKEIKLSPVEFTETETIASQTISVPDDGKAYLLKAGIMLPNLKPIVYGDIHTQVVILRLDDLRVSSLDSFVSLASWAAQEEVPLSIGMVCNSIDENNDSYIQAVKDMAQSGYVEIWCHGYDHTYHEGTGITAEFRNQTPEYQAAILQKCYDNVYAKTDGVVKLSCLGTPSGSMEENTFLALEMVPEYKVNFGNASIPYDGTGFLNLTNSLWMEPSTGTINSLDTLKGFYDNRSTGLEYVIYGGHSGMWDDDEVQIFKDFVNYLKTKELVIMTPTQYYNFIN